MTGTTAECLLDYANRLLSIAPRGSKNASLVRLPLANFVGTGHRTVERWILDPKSLPKGMYLLKLRFFLQMIGYNITEIKNLSKEARLLAELMAFDILTLEGARIVLGLTPDNEDGIYRVVLGRGNILPSKVASVKKTCLVHLNELQSTRQDFERSLDSVTQDIMSSLGAKSFEGPEVAEEKKEEVETAILFEKEKVLETLAYMTLAMLPLAERVSSEDFSAEERKALRQMTSDGIFKLSNELNKLCGEKARQMVLSGKVQKGGGV